MLDAEGGDLIGDIGTGELAVIGLPAGSPSAGGAAFAIFQARKRR